VVVADTSFLVAYERASDRRASELDALIAGAGPLRVPAAAWTEFLAFLPPAKRSRAVAELESSASFEAFTRELADEAARLQHELLREGRPLSWNDLQIAATALHFGEPLLTADRAFARVPGLEIVSP
jgi:predicted nucleic acid-binding protein